MALLNRREQTALTPASRACSSTRRSCLVAVDRNDKATSYLPVIDLLKGYFHIGDRDTHQDREKITGKILTPDRTLEAMVPVLALLTECARARCRVRHHC